MKVGWKNTTLGEVCTLDKNKHDGSEMSYVGMDNIGAGTGAIEGVIEVKSVKSSTFYFTDEHVLYGRLLSLIHI